jgi:FkbM family methyltransferase
MDDFEARWSLVLCLYKRYGVALDYEHILRENFGLLLSKGDWVVDVGAHSGAHTGRLAEIVGESGRVLAVEPLEYFCAMIRDKFSRVSQVAAENVALSDFSGTSAFTVARGTPEESGLRRKDYLFPDRADPVEIVVQVRTLDQIVAGWPRLNYIKIDIEGAELDCLNGGLQAIARHRPVISFECGSVSYSQFGKTAADFSLFAQTNGFRIFDLFGHDLTEPSRWSRVVDRARTWDFYFVPIERAEWFENSVRIAPLP